ncbi:MAG: metallophosphoesterase [Bacteriovoracaceae bacterium]|nr:metallophosphoesterase [Bacteriovoracaceae bacterium]
MKYSSEVPSLHKSGFVLIGDTQRTMAYQVLMGREFNNDPERRVLLNEIAALSPDFLGVLGDLVTYGQFKSDWDYFDSVMKPIREKKISVLPIVGNHDYFLFSRSALPYLKARFDLLRTKTWHSFRYGNCALITLDSNAFRLKHSWHTQISWYQEQMSLFENDPTIEHILVFSHHPPFTNSLEIRPHRPSREEILPTFLKSKKATGYFTGHCHAYERFMVEGKTFVVSGGGGGPRQPLLTGRWQRSKDQYAGKWIRPFHYLHFTIVNNKLQFTVHGLEKGERATRILETVQLSR